MSIEQLNTLDRFAANNGIRLVTDVPDATTDAKSTVASATMVVEERHLNGAGVCQGGALFTLADLAAAGLTRGEKLTVDSSIQFLRPGKLGDRLMATARLRSDGRMALVETEIRNQDDVLIALVTARFVTILA